MRRLSLIAVFLIACSGGETIPLTTTPPPTTRAPATTTTTLPFLAEAPRAWERVVRDVYGPPCRGDRSGLPKRLRSLPPAQACPVGGMASTAQVDGATLAVAEVGQDVIYGVDSGSGFKIVAARLPSLGLAEGWYGPVPKLVAVVGSDARPGQDAANSRADSLHLVGLDGSGAGGLLGIPRDSWVPIDQRGNNKINAALSIGGPDLMVETLREVSGLEIEGVVLTGFEGFVNLWDSALGRAEVEVPQAIRDAAAKADLEAGRQELDGTQALAFSRARKTLAGGDLTRQLHGGLVLLGALAKVQAQGPLELPELFAASQPWLVTDLGWGRLLAFAALAIDTPATGIINRVVPARVGTAGSASVVFLTDAAPAVFADLADGSLEP